MKFSICALPTGYFCPLCLYSGMIEDVQFVVCLLSFAVCRLPFGVWRLQFTVTSFGVNAWPMLRLGPNYLLSSLRF